MEQFTTTPPPLPAESVTVEAPPAAEKNALVSVIAPQEVTPPELWEKIWATGIALGGIPGVAVSVAVQFEHTASGGAPQ